MIAHVCLFLALSALLFNSSYGGMTKSKSKSKPTPPEIDSKPAPELLNTNKFTVLDQFSSQLPLCYDMARCEEKAREIVKAALSSEMKAKSGGFRAYFKGRILSADVVSICGQVGMDKSNVEGTTLIPKIDYSVKLYLNQVDPKTAESSCNVITIKLTEYILDGTRVYQGIDTVQSDASGQIACEITPRTCQNLSYKDGVFTYSG